MHASAGTYVVHERGDVDGVDGPLGLIGLEQPERASVPELQGDRQAGRQAGREGGRPAGRAGELTRKGVGNGDC